MTKHRQKSKRRRIAGAAAAVLVVGAVGIPTVAQASDNGLGGWRIVSFSWWGWGKSDPVAAPTPSRSPVASATASPTASGTPASATTAPSASPSASPSSAAPSASPLVSSSPTATPTAGTLDEYTPPSSPSPAASASSTPSASAGTSDSGPTDRVLVLVNAERTKAGCAPLTENAKLTKAAQDHSQDMADHTNMSHTGSDGSSMSDRLSRVGYTFRSAGENVAAGYNTPESVMDGWMNSPGHRANILNCGFKEIGIGLAQPGYYWTQDFGSAA